MAFGHLLPPWAGMPALQTISCVVVAPLNFAVFNAWPYLYWPHLQLWRKMKQNRKGDGERMDQTAFYPGHQDVS